MIKFENTEVMGWEHAIGGMRNPMAVVTKRYTVHKPAAPRVDYHGNVVEMVPEHDEVVTEYSNQSDSRYFHEDQLKSDDIILKTRLEEPNYFVLGPKDLDLMKRLRNAGTDHRKFMRMITVYVDITAPLYFWKEFSTYKVGTVANSCSTMHKIHAKEFTLDDFSCEHLDKVTLDTLEYVITQLEYDRKLYLKYKDKKFWWQMIQLLPSSYNQKRTVMMNYEVLANIYKSRKNHRLDEWAYHEGVIDGGKTNKEYIGFCDWIETLPYSELITGELGE